MTQNNDHISFDEAMKRIESNFMPMAETMNLPLNDALNHILAEDIIAPINSPPYDNSAVDGFGYGKDNGDMNGNQPLKIVGRAIAGRPYEKIVKSGEAVKIFTGALIPDGVDKVAMLEDCTLADNDFVHPPRQKTQGANIRLAGEDVKKGTAILKQGRCLNPADLSLLASVGLSIVKIYKPLKIAVFSTGNEVVSAPKPLKKGQLYDSNRIMLLSWLKALGHIVTDLGILPDDYLKIRQALFENAKSHDVLITSGGMSMGEEDHVRDILTKEGELNFWHVAMKPGRPLGLGKIKQKDKDTIILGLPGNGLAVFTCFMTFGRALLGHLSGETPLPIPPIYMVKAGQDFHKKKGRREFIRANKIGEDNNGIGLYKQCGKSGAAMLSSLIEADGFIEFFEDQIMVKEGDFISFRPFIF